MVHHIRLKCYLLALAMGSFFMSFSQAGYKEGDTISNFTATRILNSSLQAGSWNDLKKEITLIDFFGTWCAPCMKALPLLEDLQKRYPGKLGVLLVSIENEVQLNKFIAAEKNLPFPVIADGGGTISDLFQPPSYPYTVVINNSNEVIAITEATAITDEKIKGWLAKKTGKQHDVLKNNTPVQENKVNITGTGDQNPLTALSAEFIYTAKTNNETNVIEKKLQEINFNELQTGLKTDDEKKAFWINIYNGYTQLLLKKDAGKYKKRNKFFKAKQIPIAGKLFSLDEIEHDILRRSKIKWSLGYFNKLFPSKKTTSLRVQQIDYRIHFALNCGARSCPPIAFYDPVNLQSQLDVATRSYLTGEATYNAEKNVLQLPAIMGWFRHDFKGKKHMLELVKKYDIVPQEKKPAIAFKKYDWNLYVNNYKN